MSAGEEINQWKSEVEADHLTLSFQLITSARILLNSFGIIS